MHEETVSTGQAAKLCSVTTDTVLKWIKRGRLRASRTTGGHYRIARTELERCQGLQPRRLHCWEYHRQGAVLHPNCGACIVYRARAARCWELARVGSVAGHSLAFCTSACEECGYYRLMRGRAAQVLLLSEDPVLAESVHGQCRSPDLSVEVAESEYALSALVQTFVPDFVIIDEKITRERVSSVARSLLQDARLRLEGILIASEGKIDKRCPEGASARIGRPFTLEQLSECISRIRAVNSR